VLTQRFLLHSSSCFQLLDLVFSDFQDTSERNNQTEFENQKIHLVGRKRTKFLIKESNIPPDPSSNIHLQQDQDIVILCFNVDSGVSLARILSVWSFVPDFINTILVGTMSDIRQSLGTPGNSYQTAMAIAKQIKAVTYFEVSAKSSYSSISTLFEAAALSLQTQHLSRQSSINSNSSVISKNRKYNSLYKRDLSEPRTKPPKIASLNCLKPPGLSQSRSYCSSSSLHSKSSTLSSRKSSASVISISTNKTPVVPRKSIKQNKPEQMVTIKVERMNKEKQMEEVEIEIPMDVYQNMDSDNQNEMEPGLTCDNDFVRNCGKRNSLVTKLKQLMLR